MTTIFGFEPALAVAIAAVTLVYNIFSLSPLIFAAAAARFSSANMNRKFLFIALVAVLSYGLLFALLIVLCVPITLFMIFIVPTLKAYGYLENWWLLTFAEFFWHWWWVFPPPTLATLALITTKYLAKRWSGIVNALSS